VFREVDYALKIHVRGAQIQIVGIEFNCRGFFMNIQTSMTTFGHEQKNRFLLSSLYIHEAPKFKGFEVCEDRHVVVRRLDINRQPIFILDQRGHRAVRRLWVVRHSGLKGRDAACPGKIK
jgi:hypothetical protein